MKYNYIIYHRNCYDGYTGFYLFMKTKLWTKDVIIYPDVPSAKKPPPSVEGKDVIIMDVAYKPDIIKTIASKAKSVLFIDHHVTIKNEVDSLNMDNLEVIYDVNKSGASLVWQYFYPGKPLPKFVEHIEDNDIGRWSDPNTLHFMAGLEVHYKPNPNMHILKEWDSLLNDSTVNQLIEKGKQYNVYKNYLTDKNAKKYSLVHFPSDKLKKDFPHIKNKYIVAVTSGGCPTVSLLGKKIVETVDCDFCMVINYIVKRKLWVCSMRSNKADVGTIAKVMGGGGHKFAAAFSFSSEHMSIDDLFNRMPRNQ